jgi:hypothetical protein
MDRLEVWTRAWLPAWQCGLVLLDPELEFLACTKNPFSRALGNARLATVPLWDSAEDRIS